MNRTEEFLYENISLQMEELPSIGSNRIEDWLIYTLKDDCEKQSGPKMDASMNCCECKRAVRLLVDGFCEDCYIAFLAWLEHLEVDIDNEKSDLINKIKSRRGGPF
jgi:hypothetical protein